MPDDLNVDGDNTPLNLATNVTLSELAEVIHYQWGQDEVLELFAQIESLFADYDFCKRCRDHFQAELDKEDAACPNT